VTEITLKGLSHELLIFVIPANHKWRKVDWLDALRVHGWRCIGRFPPGLAYSHNPPANGKQRLIPEEMSQTLLTNKKQENLD
jgi:hypothetical protein